LQAVVPSFHLSLGPHVKAQYPCMCPLNYKREGTLRYKAFSFRLTHTHLDSQSHKFIQALKLNIAHSGVGYYAPVARTTLNPCVFLCSLSI
jgi:hypothetical protein